MEGGGGGGYPTSKWQSPSERNNTTENTKWLWLVGLSEYNNSLFPAVFE